MRIVNLQRNPVGIRIRTLFSSEKVIRQILHHDGEDRNANLDLPLFKGTLQFAQRAQSLKLGVIPIEVVLNKNTNFRSFSQIHKLSIKK